jgi:hypothetical protein
VAHGPKTLFHREKLTQFWEIPRHSIISYSLFTPYFVRLSPSCEPASTPQRLVHKKTWRDSLPIDMLLSVVSVLVVAQPISEFPEGLMNYPVQNCKQLLEGTRVTFIFR